MLRLGRAWVRAHPDEWLRLKSSVKNDVRKFMESGSVCELRISPYVEMLRERGVGVDSDIRAYLSRRLERELRADGLPVRFTKHASKIDPLMKAGGSSE